VLAFARTQALTRSRAAARVAVESGAGGGVPRREERWRRSSAWDSAWKKPAPKPKKFLECEGFR